MSDQTLFDNEVNTQPKEENTQSSNYLELLKEIKNDKGEQKYKTPEEAFKALKHAQDYIPTLHQQIDALKAEKEALEDKYDKSLSIEEKLDLLLNKESTETDVQERKPSVESNFNIDQIDEIIEKRLMQREQISVEKKNLSVVNSTFENLYGEKAKEVIANKATEMGVTPEYFKNIAKTSPSMLFSIFGINSSKGTPNLSSSFKSESLRQVENSEIKRNVESKDTTNKLMEEFRRSKTMNEQLGSQGLSVEDLTNPRVYFKYFN